MNKNTHYGFSKKTRFQMDTNKSHMNILPSIPNDPGLPYIHLFIDFYFLISLLATSKYVL
jgi:hypothetical protein